MRRLFLLAVVSAAGLALAGSLAASDRRAAASADLKLEVVARSTVKVGTKTVYNFSVDNRGPDNAGGLLTIEIPASFERTTGPSSGAGCGGSATVLTCLPVQGV